MADLFVLVTRVPGRIFVVIMPLTMPDCRNLALGQFKWRNEGTAGHQKERETPKSFQMGKGKMRLFMFS